MEEEVLEIKPNILQFTVNDYEAQVEIQNLTLHFIRCHLHIPNRSLFAIETSELSIAPCTTITIKISLIVHGRMNLQALKCNKAIYVCYYDQDEMEDQNIKDWNLVPLAQLGRQQIMTEFEIQSLAYKTHELQFQQSIFIEVLHQSFKEDIKKLILTYFQQHLGKYQNYKTLNDSILFILDHSIDISNQLVVLEHEKQLVYLSIYQPNLLNLANIKYKIEPMSPTQIHAKVIHPLLQPIIHPIVQPIEQPEQIASSPEMPQKVDIKPLFQKTTPVSARAQSIQIASGTQLYESPITRQSVHTKPIPTDWEKRAKNEQKSTATPVIMKSDKMYYILQQREQQQETKITKICELKAYQVITDMLLFRDGKYLVTVGDKQDIKVWNLSIKGVVGQLKDHENKKKILIIQEWRYIDMSADENYDFQQKDPEEIKEQLYTKYETAYRFITGCEDQIFRIFNLQSMKLEYQFNCRLSIPSSLAFLTDKGLFCIGGTPQKTIFGAKKYRSIRFFRMDNLQEKPKYKIFCEHEDEQIQQIIYSENPLDKDEHKHARLNNILMVQTNRKNSQGRQVVGTAKLYFIFMDRMNQCTVLLTLNCEQLNIRGIHSVKYFYRQGQFGIVESTDVVNLKSTIPLQQAQQRFLMVNIKQLQTKEGMQNGIEYNQQSEQNSKFSLLMMANPALIIVPSIKQLTFRNLMHDSLIYELQAGDPRVPHQLQYIYTNSHFVVSLVDDVIDVISLQ